MSWVVGSCAIACDGFEDLVGGYCPESQRTSTLRKSNPAGQLLERQAEHLDVIPSVVGARVAGPQERAHRLADDVKRVGVACSDRAQVR